VSSSIPTPAILNASSPQANNLFAWYPAVNATTSPFSQPDLSGNDLNLTTTFVSPPTKITTELGDILNFDGGQAGEIITASQISTPELSFALWFRQTAWPNDGGGPVYLRADAGSGRAVELRSNASPFIWAGDYGGMSSDTEITLDTWHHIVATFADSDWKFYLDGTLTGTKTSHSSPIALLQRIRLGLAFDGFTGQVADFRIYDSILSQSEVSAMYNEATRWNLYYTEPLYDPGLIKFSSERMQFSSNRIVFTP
jgi:hypothetical protein